MGENPGKTVYHGAWLYRYRGILMRAVETPLVPTSCRIEATQPGMGREGLMKGRLNAVTR